MERKKAGVVRTHLLFYNQKLTTFPWSFKVTPNITWIFRAAPAKESMRQDSNLRPLRPERSALPN